MDFQICTRCIMDTTDPEIVFDVNGYCNHCTTAIQQLTKGYLPNTEGQRRLDVILQRIRKDGKGKKYDCIIGLSGGIDSSFLAWKTKNWGLRILLFHVDGGWNTEASRHNVHILAEKLGYDLHVYTIDWEEMRDLQVAYMKSGLANLDVPQDHAFFAVLFKKCDEFGIPHWIAGMNLVSESILPKAWGYTALDSHQILDVHKRYGKRPLRTYPIISLWDYCKFYGNIPFISSIQVHTPLNLMPYDVFAARETLVNEAGWQNYGRKHEESLFTKLFQNYILPHKFGYDKRKAHYSSLIVSGVMTRDQALEAMKEPTYTDSELAEDIRKVRERLELSEREWETIMNVPCATWQDYANYESIKSFARKIKCLLRQ